MHDETFLVLKGTATFHSRGATTVAHEGDYVVVPPHAPHTFSNDAADGDLVMYNSFTPAYYVNYFRLMAEMVRGAEGGVLTGSMHREAMLRYATVQVA